MVIKLLTIIYYISSVKYSFAFHDQGGVVFSNIVTTVSPTYAQEVRTAEVWFISCSCAEYVFSSSIKISFVFN